MLSPSVPILQRFRGARPHSVRGTETGERRHTRRIELCSQRIKRLHTLFNQGIAARLDFNEPLGTVLKAQDDVTFETALVRGFLRIALDGLVERLCL